MFINIGSNKSVRKKEIVGIFDLDTASHEKQTREFLQRSEKKGIVKVCGNDLPKAFVVTATKRNRVSHKKNKKTEVFLTTLSSASLAGRNK